MIGPLTSFEARLGTLIDVHPVLCRTNSTKARLLKFHERTSNGSPAARANAKDALLFGFFVCAFGASGAAGCSLLLSRACIEEYS